MRQSHSQFAADCYLLREGYCNISTPLPYTFPSLYDATTTFNTETSQKDKIADCGWDPGVRGNRFNLITILNSIWQTKSMTHCFFFKSCKMGDGRWMVYLGWIGGILVRKRKVFSGRCPYLHSGKFCTPHGAAQSLDMKHGENGKDKKTFT